MRREIDGRCWAFESGEIELKGCSGVIFEVTSEIDLELNWGI